MRLPSTRLHLEPVPTCIPSRRRLRTSIRIRHFSSVTTADREARFAKYREADARDHPDDVTPVIEAERHAALLRKPQLFRFASGRNYADSSPSAPVRPGG